MAAQQQQYQTFWMRGRHAPRQGAASSLAGVAERGDHMMVPGRGEFVNNGTKAEPDWQPYEPEQTVFIITSEEFDRRQR